VKSSLPNVLIIGSAKCGTTSLHNYLSAHPDIKMSEVKELNFFSEPGVWERGLAWYEDQFDPSVPIRGESSTSYTRAKNAALVSERVHDTIPDARLIYLVRDPIDRIRSDYHHHRSVEMEARDLAVALADPDNPYVSASSYASQLAPYAERFGMDRIHVLTQEELLRNRRATLAAVFTFLGVDDSVDSPLFDRTWERSAGKGWAFTLGVRLRQRGVRLPPALRWPAQRLQRTWLLGGRSRAARPQSIDDEIQERLAEELAPEVARLREMTGMDFPNWSL
jgi:hypothetical protein